MPSLRSSIRKRLEAEEAEQQADNPVEAAAQEAVQKKLDEQPEPVLAQQPGQPGPLQRMAEARAEAEYADDVNKLELQAADASAQIAGHSFGSREYIAAIENRLRPQEEDRRPRERTPSMMAPVTRSIPSWSSGRTTPTKTELTGEEIALAHSLGGDPEEYRRNKAKMHQLKASGVIQE